MTAIQALFSNQSIYQQKMIRQNEHHIKGKRILKLSALLAGGWIILTDFLPGQIFCKIAYLCVPLITIRDVRNR